MNPSAPLRGGIVGCGFFAQFHIEAWRRMPDVELSAAADPEIERASAAAPRAYSSAEEMLDHERLDFLDIATRPESHLPLVRLAASRKIPVICQKPMAPSWADALGMVDAAESAGIPLMIHENWRWQPWYRAARLLIDCGAIGRPIHYWFRTRRNDGAGSSPYPNQPYFASMPRLLIWETLVHHIDTARFLFGDLVAIYAQARRRNPVIAGEDQAVLTLTHADLSGLIDGHRFLDPDPDGPALGDACIEGESGALRIPATGDIFLGQDQIWTNQAREGYRGDSVRATQRHFIDCLRSGSPFESSGREYLKTFRAVEAAYESIAERRAISLLADPPGEKGAPVGETAL
jgi:D-apiose dehydrogenase